MTERGRLRASSPKLVDPYSALREGAADLGFLKHRPLECPRFLETLLRADATLRGPRRKAPRRRQLYEALIINFMRPLAAAGGSPSRVEARRAWYSERKGAHRVKIVGHKALATPSTSRI